LSAKRPGYKKQLNSTGLLESGGAIA